MYDVIVVGAGPAGCMAAKRIAHAGHKVLLVEKRLTPRAKSCSGILIKKSVDLVKKYFGKIPDTVLCKPNKNLGIIITNEEERVLRFESEGLNIWRSSFDYWLALRAKDAGAEFRPSTSALSCEEQDDHIVIKLKGKEILEEKARIVIACDGAGSTIKKNLLKTQNDYIITYQTFCKGSVNLDNRFFHAYLHPRFSEYDAWFNVKDDFIIFGVGVKDISKIKSYHAEFTSFLASRYKAEIGSVFKAERWIIPHIMPGCPVDLGKGRVLFAGEAGNFLNPMGEGISSALVSGYAAAEAVKQIYVKDKEVSVEALLSAYESNVEEERDYMIRQWEFLARISPKFSYLKSKKQSGQVSL